MILHANVNDPRLRTISIISLFPKKSFENLPKEFDSVKSLQKTGNFKRVIIVQNSLVESMCSSAGPKKHKKLIKKICLQGDRCVFWFAVRFMKVVVRWFLPQSVTQSWENELFLMIVTSKKKKIKVVIERFAALRFFTKEKDRRDSQVIKGVSKLAVSWK